MAERIAVWWDHGQAASHMGPPPHQPPTPCGSIARCLSRPSGLYIVGFTKHGWQSEPHSPNTNVMCKRWDTRRKTDRRSQWMRQLLERRGKNRTAVAVANKNARIVWALLTSHQDYQPATS